MLRRIGVGGLLLTALAGCGGDGPVALLRGASELDGCPDVSALLARVVGIGGANGTPASTIDPATGALSLAPLEGVTVLPSEALCVQLTAAGARFLVVPQYASEGRQRTSVGFVLTAEGIDAASADVALPAISGNVGTLQHQLDMTLRRRERELKAPRTMHRAPLGAAPSLQVSTFDSLRDFRVLGDLNANTFKTSSARLKYTGDFILLYLDTLAPPGFTDAALAEFGRLFDNPLFAITMQAFGGVSDIDNNGRVIVLLTQHVNALTAASECLTSGYVTGYFYGFDLVNTGANSNRGEIFYGLVPDPNGVVSCAHSVAEVGRVVPATFVHELQHMISFNEHVLVRGGQSEVVWLNESLSHISEELASRYYEDKYPPPLGRTSPDQLFPDSSQGFIVGNLLNANRYLEQTERHSVTTFEDFGTLAERGAGWLFVRYLADQKGADILRRLVQTNLTGVRNVETQAGEGFGPLFGGFSIAIWTDSLPGIPRTQIPLRYRFTSRNLRQIYARLNQTGAIARAYPVNLELLSAGRPVTETMFPGTMDLFQIDAAPSAAAIELQLDPQSASFPVSLNPQLGIFRLPD